jgi:uncharacterized membrane protein YhaH (DUF805 family)
MDWKYLYTSRAGRISRKPYWLASLALIAVSLAINLLLGPVIGVLPVLILSLPIFYASYALNLKRGHDRDRPDWYITLFFVLLLLINIGQLTAPDPMNPGTLLNGALIVIGFWSIVMLIDLGFLRGTAGPNRYGPDPLAS